MNAKKIFQQAFKSVPEKYVTEDSRIFIRAKHQGIVSTFAVVIVNPSHPTIIWTKEEGWEIFNE